jgi:hypothetical protein
LSQEGLDNDETTALKLHFASNSKISDVQKQIKDAVLNPSSFQQGKLEVLMAKAEHARLSGPDVSKLRDLLNRIQITKGSLEQAIVEKKESQLIQSLNEGRELNLNPVLLQQGERALQQIIERKNKRLMAKMGSGMSTPAMQAIAMSSASSNMASNAQSDKQDAAAISAAPAAKMSLIQEVIRSLSLCVFLYGFTPLFILFIYLFYLFFMYFFVMLTLILSGKHSSAPICIIVCFPFRPRETGGPGRCAACPGARPRKRCIRTGDASEPLVPSRASF